jgi:hypothetical protein
MERRPLQVVPDVDIHPNGRGHEILMENLYNQLRAQPAAWKALIGAKDEAAAPGESSAANPPSAPLPRR